MLYLFDLKRYKALYTKVIGRYQWKGDLVLNKLEMALFAKFLIVHDIDIQPNTYFWIIIA